MQTLNVSSDVIDNLEPGNNYLTIQAGKLPLDLGDLVLAASDDARLVKLRSLSWLSLGDVPDEMIAGPDGVVDRDAFFERMRASSPEISLDDPVTIIVFHPL